MENIENLNIDITAPKQNVTGPSGKTKVTSTNWKPNAGAEAARQELERQKQAMYEMQQQIENQDPRVQQLNALTATVKHLDARVLELEKSLTKVLAHE